MSSVALQLYTINAETEKDFLGSIKKVAQIGYDGVEFAGYFGTPMTTIKQVLDDCGLQAAGTHFGVDLLESQLDQIIADALALGCASVGCPGFWGVDYEQVSTFERFANLFNRVGEQCQAQGLKFLYHIHGHEFVTLGDTTGMDILLDQTNPEWVTFQPDIYWIQRAGVDPVDFIKQHASRCDHIHLKDATDSENWRDTEVGSGIVNTRGVVDVLKNQRVAWWIVEQEVFDMPPFESVAISLKHVRELVTGASQ